jgi:hypothetical protein
LEVGAHVEVARGQFPGAAIGADGAADLAGLEPRVAQVEINRRRRLPGLRHRLVDGGGGRELAFFVKLVGLVEWGGGGIGAGGGRGQQQQQNAAGALHEGFGGRNAGRRGHLLQFVQGRFHLGNEGGHFLRGVFGGVAELVAGLD